MRKLVPLAAIAAIALAPSPVLADASTGFDRGSSASSGRELPPYLQCVPYARQQSGIQIYGDAHTWWGKAAGRYARGNKPKLGAVMAFQPHRNMRLGHVAAVSRIIDNRTVLLRHANWSPINGRRGQIELDVKAIDVSPNNDWSAVRVWYHPIQGLGKTAWPVHGFIYSDKAPSFSRQTRIARVTQPAPKLQPQAVRAKSSDAFLSAFANLSASKPAPARISTPSRKPSPKRVSRAAPVRNATADPFAAVIARYEK